MYGQYVHTKMYVLTCIHTHDISRGSYHIQGMPRVTRELTQVPSDPAQMHTRGAAAPTDRATQGVPLQLPMRDHLSPSRVRGEP